MSLSRPFKIEWPTIVAIIGCYALWLALVFAGENLHWSLWIIGTALVTTFYWSLVHEIVHGHPSSNQTLNELFVTVPIGWIYPIDRFRDTHLKHHNTGELTDPFDDPESWYLSGPDWQNSTGISRKILQFNNTLFGRMLIGPVIAASRFVISETSGIVKGGTEGRQLAWGWLKHLILCLMLCVFVAGYSAIPVWQFVIAAYLSISVLLIRTFLEHQAMEDHSERTVIIEALCPLAFLFLYNNLHCVHHVRPGIAWYSLPEFYRKHRTKFVKKNNGYVYRSYAQVIRKYFFRSKEPVGHPFLRA